MDKLMNILMIIMAILIGVPWVLCMAAPLLIAVAATLSPFIYAGYSGYIRLRRAIANASDIDRLKVSLKEYLDQNIENGEACACVTASKEGPVKLVVQFKTQESTWSHQVMSDNLHNAVSRIQGKLYQKTSCVLRCGVFPCANCLHCPSRSAKYGIRTASREIIRLTNTTVLH